MDNEMIELLRDSREYAERFLEWQHDSRTSNYYSTNGKPFTIESTDPELYAFIQKLDEIIRKHESV